MANTQFPYPRKSSVPAAHTTSSSSSSRTSSLRQRRAIRTYGPLLLGLVTTIWLLLYLFSSDQSSSSTTSTTRRPPGTPEVVIVTTLDPSLPPALAASIRENRNHFAALHNYATFFPNTSAYDLMPNMPSSWSTIPAIRHAMALHPHTPWAWYLSSTALIMDPSTSLTTRLLDPPILESLIIPDHPVVPPDSVIHTSPHRLASRVDLIISQDGEGLAGDSLLVRSGDWAKFFLDAWFDPLYRSYNFQKAEGHALEHIVQWHGSVLTKLALVPQKALNSYMGARMAKGVQEKELFQEGDFVANFHGCLRDETRSCEVEMGPMITRWRELRDQERKEG